MTTATQTKKTVPEPYFNHNDIQTYSGRAYDFQNPTVDMVSLEDIAHSLSNMCRFAGHVRLFQSVAEHCVLVSKILERQGYERLTQAVGLFHDAHEAYVWDCPRPFKPLLGREFAHFAESADWVIARKIFNDGSVHPGAFKQEIIKTADDIALVAEASELMHHGPERWIGWEERYQFVEPLPEGLHVNSLEPQRAEYLFLDRATQLGIGG